MRLRAGLAALAAIPLAAGSLQGSVRILDKDGTLRAGLKDAIAILEPVNAPRPALPTRPPVRIRTVGKKFVPRVAWTTVGSEAVFPNQDAIIHNVFSVCCAAPFDTHHYEPGDSPSVRLFKPGLAKLYCNVHASMYAFLWVVDTPYVELLEGKRGVSFQNLPRGTYLLRLWHPETGEHAFAVTVTDEAVP